MDEANVLAAWIGAAATTVGLGSLVAQTTALKDQLDPFSAFRSAVVLGPWANRQTLHAWYELRKRDPEGPVITASMSRGFCDQNLLWLSRRPSKSVGTATWAMIMGILLHPECYAAPCGDKTPVTGDEMPMAWSSDIFIPLNWEPTTPSLDCWSNVPLQTLKRQETSAYLPISRITLITLLCVTNARATFQHSGAAGYRGSFPSYIGPWTVEWPIGKPAVVRLASVGVHEKPGTDPYPPALSVRVDRCVQMLCGICEARNPEEQSVAYPGRKSTPGILYWRPSGYSGAHGSRPLYNLSGGKVYKVGFLWRGELSDSEEKAHAARAKEDGDLLRLSVPSLDKGLRVSLFVPRAEEDLIIWTLDHLPWSSLSWSMHRGMKDILLAYGRKVMDRHRHDLASALKQCVERQQRQLMSRGWSTELALHHMADMVYSTVVAGVGDSGDCVRAMTEAAVLLVGGGKMLDVTSFWSRSRLSGFEDGEGGGEGLSADAVVALTKYVVLEWSQELDYQMFQQLPFTVFLDT